MHILPPRFVKIRRYGIYNATVKRNNNLIFTIEQKQDIQDISLNNKPNHLEKESTLERFERITGIDVTKCPFCKKGKMRIIKNFPLLELQISLLLKQNKLFDYCYYFL